MARILRNILLYGIEAIIIFNLIAILALNIPFVQSRAGSFASGVISDLLKTEVSIGKVDLGMLNQVIISDIEIKDQQKKTLLTVRKLAGKVDFFMLKKNQIAFNTIQLLHFKANMNQPKEGQPTNFQFIIDALSSKEKSESQTNVRINSLIIRDGEIVFDKLYKPKRESLDLNHLHVQDLNAHVSLKSILKDSIRVRLRQLSFREASGLNLQNMTMTVMGSQKDVLITQFFVNLPHTNIQADTLKASFNLNDPNILTNLQSQGKMSIAPLTLSDLSFVVPKLKDFKDPIYADLDVAQQGYDIQLNRLGLHTAEKDLQVQALANVHLPADSTQRINAWAKIKQFEVQSSAVNMVFNNLHLGQTPAILSRVGNIHFEGDIQTDGNNVGAQGSWQTGIGKLETNVSLGAGNSIKGQVNTKRLNLGELLANNQLGDVIFDLEIDGHIQNGKPSGKVLGDVTSFWYNNYNIKDIHLDAFVTPDEAKGTINVGDENLKITLDGSASISQHLYDIEAQLDNLRPSVLGFMKDQDRIYSGSIKAELQGTNVDNLVGNIDINRFSVQDSSSVYELNRLKMNAVANDDGQRRMSLYSDFMTAEIQGKYLYTTLPRSFINVLERYIPSLVGYQKSNEAPQNHFTFNVKLNDATPLKQILNLPIEIQEPVSLVGFFNDPQDKLDIDMIAGSFDYSGSHYEQARVRCQNNEKSFLADVNVNKFNKASVISLGVHAQAQDDRVSTAITWDNNKDVGKFRGQLNANANFDKVPGLPMHININVQPSDVTLNDTLWNIRPAQIDIQGKRYAINNLNIENGDRHLHVNGVVSENPTDSLIADLKEINVEYVLDAVNFHAVQFSGYASGRAYASNLLHEMQADTHLFVRDFRFMDGLMGNMNVYGRWENEPKAIYVNGHIAEFGASDTPADSTQVWKSWNGLGDYVGRTHVEGQISPAHNTIDLDIDAQNTSVAFLKGFVGTVFDNISGRATGWCHIGNTLKNVDITAGIKAELNARVRSLNTTYKIQADSVSFLTNHMMFRGTTITDRDGRKAQARGDVEHYYLHNLKYDFRINTDNLLCYETHDFGEGTPFFATAYAGGNISIIGQSGLLRINADVTANEGTTFVYDATVPEEVSNTQFITFVDKTPRIAQELVMQDDQNKVEKTIDKEESDLYIDMNVDMTPGATVRVLMDQISGDFISASGTGNLKASYYNKGSFKMFGLYNINKGLYRMSMQEVIRKDFNLQDGGVVNFNGDPFSAQLDVKAAYTVNSASLRDLSPTATFAQKTSTRVNCVMNIEGSLLKPSVTFDLDLPTVSEEDKSMVKSLVATEEQMNLQIIYLLGVGRFYGGDYAQNSGNQTNQAMNSILTSTLSGQFNQMLSKAIDSNNWNLGANINPGQNGMNDMEFQTMLQGSLFNNRLLINGNFGYKENAMMNTNFVGDFDVQWMLNKARTISLKAYNETNDRYFTRNTLNTQGLGIQVRREFERWSDLFHFSRRNQKK